MNATLSERVADRNLIACESALRDPASFDAIVDVRSPSEFAQDHVPGALNAPVLDDAQRAQVGALHKQSGTFSAKRLGAALVARNIADHVDRLFGDKPREWRPLVYCWRGGQRSAAMVHVLSKIGWHARQLDGGYRAYRRQVIAELEQLPLPLQWRVITGTTGSGKSRLLQHIAAVGGQVLDLEALAQHRGSVLGGLPRAPQPSQKMFESLLWTALRRLTPQRPVFVESESRKVGDLRLPDALLNAMRSSPCLRLELPLDQRVQLLRDDYVHFEQNPEALIAQLRCLAAVHGNSRIDDWTALVHSGNWPALVERLLTEHYDPAYQRSIRANFSQSNDAPALTAPSASDAAFRALARQLVAG